MRDQKALAVIGGDHDPENITEEVGRAFGAVGVSVEFTEQVERLSAQELASVHLFVLFRQGRVWPRDTDNPTRTWMTGEQESALADFISKGGGFLALHQSDAYHPQDGPFRRLLGGHFAGHPPVKTFSVKVVDSTHPVTRGVEDYVVSDEQHFLEYDEDELTLLTKSYSEDGEAPSGWVRQYGQGRVCYLANGHTLETLLNAQFQRLVQNAILWCLKRQAP